SLILRLPGAVLFRMVSSRQRVRWRRRTRAGGTAPSAHVRRPAQPIYMHADAERERALETERAQFARRIDIELRVACRMEAASRHELGTVARELLSCRAHRR